MQRYNLGANRSTSGKGDLTDYDRAYKCTLWSCCFGSLMIVERNNRTAHEFWRLDVWNPERQTKADVTVINDKKWEVGSVVCVSDNYSFWNSVDNVYMSHCGNVESKDSWYKTHIETSTYKRYCATGNSFAEYYPNGYDLRLKIYDVTSMQLVSSATAKDIGDMWNWTTIGSEDRTTMWSIHVDKYASSRRDTVYYTDTRIGVPEMAKQLDVGFKARFLPMIDEKRLVLTGAATIAIFDTRNCGMYTLDQLFEDGNDDPGFYYSA